MSCARRPKPTAHHDASLDLDRAPRMVAVYRRGDSVCHARCGKPLVLHGVRGLLEADFYCYACLTHVTIPLAVLDDVPVERGDAVAQGAGR